MASNGLGQTALVIKVLSPDAMVLLLLLLLRSDSMGPEAACLLLLHRRRAGGLTQNVAGGAVLCIHGSLSPNATAPVLLLQVKP